MPVPADFDEVQARLVAAYGPPSLPVRAPEPLTPLIRLLLGQQNTAPVARRQLEALQTAYPAWEAAWLDGPDGLTDTLRSAGAGWPPRRPRSSGGF
ncbi:hypothetical protein ACFP81_01100 [Deinococcus lacus]|uniref:Endonuclease III n=1 Tax=Deinococcus lacus TaxID=392561 RepID=A0ABW1Y9A1_9DEIO